jgi:hypothetical protein
MASDSGPSRLRQVQVPGRAGASSLALCCTITPSASTCSRSSEYITFCFSLCGHPAGTNYITCPLCRLSRRVQTRLQVLALHQVFLHSTRPTPHSRTRGLHRRKPTRRGRGRRRSGGLACPTGTTTRRRGQGGLRHSHSHKLSLVGVRWSKVGALGPLGTAPGPLGTAPRARYL